MLAPEQSNHKQAINNLIASIALQESFFSDVIVNESHRLNTMINSKGITPEELYNAKVCLSEISQAITGLERILQAKIEFFESEFQQ